MTILFWCIASAMTLTHPRSSVVAVGQAYQQGCNGRAGEDRIYFPTAICRTRAGPGKRCAHGRIVSAGTA